MVDATAEACYGGSQRWALGAAVENSIFSLISFRLSRNYVRSPRSVASSRGLIRIRLVHLDHVLVSYFLRSLLQLCQVRSRVRPTKYTTRQTLDGKALLLVPVASCSSRRLLSTFCLWMCRWPARRRNRSTQTNDGICPLE